MKDYSIQSAATGRRRAVGRILLEAAFVALVGGVFAFAANEISPRGLALARNYFPTGTNNLVRMTANASPPRDAADTNSAVFSPARLLAAELKKNGLQLLNSGQTEKLFHDPGFQRGAIIFVDARDEARYRAGHVPGAYEFDPYHPEKYFSAVLPVCQAAEQIVVYCNGGDCDDSESAALLLRDVGIPGRKLFVYGGGITEWTNNRLPVETGARNGGSLRNLNQ